MHFKETSNIFSYNWLMEHLSERHISVPLSYTVLPINRYTILWRLNCATYFCVVPHITRQKMCHDPTISILSYILLNYSECFIPFMTSFWCSTTGRLEFLGYVPVLIKLASGPRKRSHEHVLSLLAMMVEENQSVAEDCKNPEHNLKEVLSNHLNACRNKPEYRVL